MLFYRNVKFLLTRSIVFYLVCFICLWRLLDYAGLMDNAVPQTMSRLTPPIDYFAEFVDKQDHFDRFKLMNCVNYHKAVAHFFDFQKAEAYGMLGFCEERLGKQSQAMASYRQAIALNPDYFWPYYDLGVIFYRQGQYSKAEDYFQRSLEQNPMKTIFLLSRSKVYNDVRLSKQEGSYDFLQGLKEGRTNAYLLMMDSLYKTASYGQLWEIATDGLKEGLDVHGLFYYYAGIALFYQQSYQKAISLLQIALEHDAHNSDALLYTGMCLKVIGKQDLGQEMMDKAALLHKQEGSMLEQYLKPRVRFF